MPLQWGSRERAVDFFDVKGDVEALLAPRARVFERRQHPALHPGRCARIELDGRVIGRVGELHPRWRQAYDLPHAPVLFELDLDAVLTRPVPVFAAGVPRQQVRVRDMALVVGRAWLRTTR
jgi:phenylalanyl-tRNA synthetase beta chain